MESDKVRKKKMKYRHISLQEMTANWKACNDAARQLELGLHDDWFEVALFWCKACFLMYLVTFPYKSLAQEVKKQT